MSGGLLVILRVDGRYAVVVSDDVSTPSSAAVVATFPERDDAERCAAWLGLLRRAYHSARGAFV